MFSGLNVAKRGGNWRRKGDVCVNDNRKDAKKKDNERYRTKGKLVNFAKKRGVMIRERDSIIERARGLESQRVRQNENEAESKKKKETTDGQR